MPTFKVFVQQFVEETAVIELEATDLHGAIAAAQRMLDEGDIDWHDGDDIVGQLVCEVKDTDNETLWEVGA